jgi:hypothetical protein
MINENTFDEENSNKSLSDIFSIEHKIGKGIIE